MLKMELNSMKFVEELLCSFCKNYLSRSPIFVLPDGKTVCEICSKANGEVKSYRHFSFEVILQHIASFPCRYEKYGCLKSYKFDTEVEHENNCIFKPICCTFNIMFNCDWNGSIGAFGGHVKQQHSSVFKAKAEFQIDLNENKKDCFVVSQENNLFLVNYNYDLGSRQLVYIVAFYNFNIKTQFCKIQLTNTDDLDSTIEFKGCKCISYFDGLLNNSDIGKSINLHELIPLLGDPKSLSIVLTVKHDKSDNSVTEADYDLLNSYKCHLCRYYLILPLFQMEKKLICNTCHYDVECDSVPLDSIESLLLAKANYTCRWHKCNQILKGDRICDHETKCKFRIYSCICCHCELTSTAFTEHMFQYKHLYFGKQVEIKISNVKNLSLYAFVKYELVQVCFDRDCEDKDDYLDVRFYTTSKDVKKVKCKVKFQHDHCIAETRAYELVFNKWTRFSMAQMPNCFEFHNLTVLIKFL